MEQAENPKVGRGKNPNSIKNLKPRKKGDPSLNPEGARLHDKEKRKWKEATADYVREIINITVMGQPSDLEKIYNCPEEAKDAAENAKRVMAKYVHNAISSGDWPSIESLLQRVLGKVPDQVHHKISSVPEELPDESLDEQLSRAVRRS